MFTGIVETMGMVLAADKMDSSASGGGGTSLTIGNASVVLEDVHLGDSIACNGMFCRHHAADDANGQKRRMLDCD